ncbi:MAG: hypothetical protein A2Y40_05240 [Candidatus Margulisbacteria bacterium GWF2_35_9]|nr:MAG: hypothetical protein A2Y40_05240 [Candidatus Margulisbacteria bacterium GWF2_35_9]
MTVIKIENVGKSYTLRHLTKKRADTLRDAITQTVHNVGEKIIHFGKSKFEDGTREEFWALKDVSFNVEQGDRIGIIGRNGAGKSTLLKILSRITDPTTGRISIKGKVSSLLEVGTGFHPELSGRENIFLNGAILGMPRAEIIRKFDEIVAFSEVENFLDTPVKRYSSGMYVRLAFAVAAHLEPDILIVDEVLAVGDIAFQNKCLGKMESVSSEGRTVLFVSHNMTAIKALCRKCVVLDGGKISFFGDVDKSISDYLHGGSASLNNVVINDRVRDKKCTLRAKIIELSVINSDMVNPEYIDSKAPMIVKLKIESQEDVKCSTQLVIADDVQNLIWLDSGAIKGQTFEFKKGITEIECRIDPMFLYAGKYKINCALAVPRQEVVDEVHEAYTFNILELDPYNIGYNLKRSYDLGVVHVNFDWVQK